MATKTAKTSNEESLLGVVIPPIATQMITVKIVGDSPLIEHKWSEKAKKQILDKQTKKATAGKEAKDPWMDFCESLYWLTPMPEYPTMEDIANARFGFPATAFKTAAIDAGYQQGYLAKKTTARGAFFIEGEMVEIIGTPTIREDMVKIGMGVADIRYRGEFKEWSAVLTIKYNPSVMSADQIINLINLGGFSNGVGEWRMSKDGMFGCFHIAAC